MAHLALSIKVGSGLMIVKQFGGASAIVSYASDIFKLAGNRPTLHDSCFVRILFSHGHINDRCPWWTPGFSTSVGSFGMAIIQVSSL